MSTYYYLACDKCKENVPFWCRSAGGSSVITTAAKYPDTVQDFLDAHLEHGICAISEHDERNDQYADALDKYPEATED